MVQGRTIPSFVGPSTRDTEARGQSDEVVYSLISGLNTNDNFKVRLNWRHDTSFK